MSIFGKKENNTPKAQPLPPPGMPPRPPMAPGANGPMPPRPPMAPGANGPMPPRPPMAPGVNGPMAPRPPMAPGANGPMPPRPPMAPGANGPMSPRPPMAPGAAPGFGGPRPMGGPNGAISPAPGFGGPRPMAPGAGFGPTFGQAPTPSPFGPSPMGSQFSPMSTPAEPPREVNISLDTVLSAKKNYKPTRSVISNSRVSYEQFCSELTFEFFDSMLRTANLLEKKSEIIRIKKAIVFALTNTKDLPDRPRDILYNAALRLTDFLKAVVYYPEKGIINDEIVTFLPVLKDVAHAFRGFLLKNR